MFTPRDFYEIFGNTSDEDMQQVKTHIRYKQLHPKSEIAHLCGSYRAANSAYLDAAYDPESNQVLFRLSLMDDDDGWFGTETYVFVEAPVALHALHLNGIHDFDAFTTQAWAEYITQHGGLNK